MRISDWRSDVCSSDLHPCRSGFSRELCRAPGQVRRQKLAAEAAPTGLFGVPGRRQDASMSLSARISRRARLSGRSEEHTSELQSLMPISYAVFCLKKQQKPTTSVTCIHNTYDYIDSIAPY